LLRLLKQKKTFFFVYFKPFFFPSSSTTTALAEEKVGKSTKLWGGRFTKDTAKEIQEWTTAVHTDRHMVAEDIWGSLAHVTMLGRQGIIPPTAASGILRELLKLQNNFLAKTWDIGFQQEDVHMNVEAMMIAALGMDVGGRMHTCRSRNDQVRKQLRLFLILLPPSISDSNLTLLLFFFS
jgi:argininosuccinate lyase